MLSSSKFRKTRNGRAILDVLRTMNATCTAAELEVVEYMKYLYKHRDEVTEYPEAFTPYEVAKKLSTKTEPTSDLATVDWTSTKSSQNIML